MRVALVPSAYAPAVGGVEQLTRRLAACLMAAGDAVEVWTMLHPPDLPATEELDGVVVRRFPFYLPPAKPLPLLRLPHRGFDALRQLRQACAAFRPDVVHVQCFGINGVYSLALAQLEHLPLVVTLQGETLMDNHEIYERSATLRLGLRLAMRRADAVTACSQFVLDDATERFGRPHGSHEVIFNGVDLGEEAPSAPFDAAPSRFVFALGRVVRKKGFDLLLEAFARLPEDLHDVALVIAGDGPELAALRRRADDLKLGARAVFPGPLSRGEVAWAMGEADLFVLPSRIEPFGIVTLEAMRAATPVLVSRHGGGPEIVRTPDEGVLIDPFDPEQLGAELERLLRDPDLRRQMGEAGRVRAATFSWPMLTERYRHVYRAASEARGPAG